MFSLMVCVQSAVLSALLCHRILSATGYLRLFMKIMLTILNRVISIPKNKPGIIIRDSEERNICVRF